MLVVELSQGFNFRRFKSGDLWHFIKVAFKYFHKDLAKKILHVFPLCVSCDNVSGNNRAESTLSDCLWWIKRDEMRG